ncbi:MAG: hypothetical protein ACC609_11435, partial [Methanobacterium formicicum]
TIINTATKKRITGTTPTPDWNATNNGQTKYLTIPEADIQINQKTTIYNSLDQTALVLITVAKNEPQKVNINIQDTLSTQSIKISNNQKNHTTDWIGKEIFGRILNQGKNNIKINKKFINYITTLPQPKISKLIQRNQS